MRSVFKICYLSVCSALCVTLAPTPASAQSTQSWSTNVKEIRDAGALFRSIPVGDPRIACIRSDTCTSKEEWLAAVWNPVSNLVNSMNRVEEGDRESLGAQDEIEKVILHYAGVSPGDSKATIAKKTRVVAPAIMALRPRHVNFDQPDGNILKFAITKKYDLFVVLVTARWDWPPQILNKVDAVDSRNALDYAYDQLEAERGRQSYTLANKISAYIRLMEKAGATRTTTTAR